MKPTPCQPHLVLEVDGESERVHAVITWAGGHTTQGVFTRPVARFEQLSYYPQLVERLRQLTTDGLTAPKIAEQLNAESWHPPKRTDHFTTGSIQTLLRRLALSPAPSLPRPREPDGPGPNEWWLADLARHLGMPETTLYTWIGRGWVDARHQDHPSRRLILHADQQKLGELRERRSRPHGYYTRLRWTDPTAQPTPT